MKNFFRYSSRPIKRTSKNVKQKSDTHVIVRVFYDHQDGRLQLVHLPVHGVETEAVLARAEYQRPGVTLGPGGQMATQAFAVVIGENLGGSDQVGRRQLYVERGRCGGGIERPPEFLGHRQDLRTDVRFFNCRKSGRNFFKGKW